jgi:cysteine desulfurase
MSGKPIYLDFNATTPVAPQVLEAMLPYLGAEFGNPSSGYGLGRRARDAVEAARADVAALIGAHADEIVFTSGGTEASNHAIRGMAAAAAKDRRRIVTTTVEHPATAMTCGRLEREGFEVVRVGVDSTGRVDLDAMAAMINRNTALVTIIHAQNEIGTLQPLASVSDMAKAKGVTVHGDAAQSLGKVPVHVDDLGVDLLSIAGHKLYAPKGIGALYVRRGMLLAPLLDGAGQELALRPGTENVPYIVGLGTACRLAEEQLEQGRQRMATLRDVLQGELQQRVPNLFIVGHSVERLPNTLNVLFPGVRGSDLLEAVPGICASTGSACHAGDPKPSSVLLALGLPPEEALGAVRLSLGRTTLGEEILTTAALLAEAWLRLRREGREA